MRFTKFLVSSSRGVVSESELEDSACGGIGTGIGADISRVRRRSRSMYVFSLSGCFSSFFRNEAILRMVPSRLMFNLGSACNGTGGAGAERLGERSPSLPTSPMVNVLESSVGVDIMGRAVEPGLGGGNAGAARVKVSPLFSTALTTGGGGALRCGTPVLSSCTVGCTNATLGPL